MPRMSRPLPQHVPPIDDARLAARLAKVAAAYTTAKTNYENSRTAVADCVMTLRDRGVTQAEIVRTDRRANSASLRADSPYSIDPAATTGRMVILLNNRETFDAKRVAALEALCAACRDAHETHGLSYHQIANATGVTHIYVQQLITRARTGRWASQKAAS